MQLLLLLTAYAYDSQHVFYTLRVKKVTTKSNTQRLLPIKWILRDIISNQIKSNQFIVRTPIQTESQISFVFS